MIAIGFVHLAATGSRISSRRPVEGNQLYGTNRTRPRLPSPQRGG